MALLTHFANSAFATTILAVIFNKYFALKIAQGAQGVDFLGDAFFSLGFFGSLKNEFWALGFLAGLVFGRKSIGLPGPAGT